MLKRRNYAWTPEDEAALKQYSEKGMHIRAIAFRLKRSESSIKKKSYDMGVKVTLPPRGNFKLA